jgi:hypothetical protein
LGIASESEIAAVDVQEFIQPERFCRLMNGALPRDFSVSHAALAVWDKGGKKPDALMSLYWGSRYRIERTTRGDRSPSFSELADALRASDGVSDFQQRNGTIELTLESDSGRIPGIKSLLTEILGGNPIERGVSVTRLAMFAKDSRVGKPVRYADLPQFSAE